MTRRSNRHDRHDAPLQRRAAARARSKCGGSAWPGGRALRLQRHAAPTRTAHAAVARKRCPARSCMMMSETPLPTLPLGRSAKRALHQASRSAQSARRLRPPHHQEATRALSGGSTCRRSGVQRLRHRRRARSARPRPGCRIGARARSAHAIGAERVARGGDGSQRHAAPPGAARHTGAQRPRRAAPCAERRARSARRRSGSPHAPGAQRPRHRRRARSARRRQLRAGMLAQPAHGHAGRLLPASAQL